jgi:hypothetical protein
VVRHRDQRPDTGRAAQLLDIKAGRLPCLGRRSREDRVKFVVVGSGSGGEAGCSGGVGPHPHPGTVGMHAEHLGAPLAARRHDAPALPARARATASPTIPPPMTPMCTRTFLLTAHAGYSPLHNGQIT